MNFRSEFPKQASNFLPAIFWFRALACAVVFILGLVYLFSYITPIPSPDDTALLMKHIDDFEKELEKTRQEEPFVIVFLGTSRLKNMVWNKGPFQETAQEFFGGRSIKRLLLAVNWGGYQRLEPLTNRLLALKPNAIVMMPEFLTEDFTRYMRMNVTFRFFNQWKIGEPLHIFDPHSEFDGPACGNDPTAQHRLDRYRDNMQVSRDSAGPTAARQTIQLATRQGIKVYIASLPKHPDLEAISSRFSSSSKEVAESLANTNAKIKVIDFDGAIAKENFCDYAHVDAAKSEPWVRWIISEIAKDTKMILSQSNR